ncbi:FAD-dependent monooxygenase [Actinoplanes sp. RD1]|uniref:FAD-dependent monooxygenase n=1 Tax=Actinoplanes sp. RD1 TaxID=3064538 RepID=UPI0027420B77|nr:FAD-dependent monooxygenase [Actinoplanes sp. RD1]
MRTVLISGASVAGPALAYWLHRHGFEVTVVEKAPEVRGGGYPIDLRGPAVDVAGRMGLLPELRAAHIDTRTITAYDRRGRKIAALDADLLAGSGDDRHLEVPRGGLASLLYAATKDRVGYVFGDSIRTLEQDAGGVRLTFEQGAPRTVDLVVGADGVHSLTRGLAFGPEEDYFHYLGLCFGGFTVPNAGGLAYEVVLQTEVGRGLALYAVRDQPWVHALAGFAGPQPPRGWTPGDLRAMVASRLADFGGEAPRVLAALRTADDLYYDMVGQIRMPGWSAGRVAVVGDAAYAPSFLSGQGTSLALVGAYVLAGELARAGGDHVAGYAGYERVMRDFVRQNQELAGKGSATVAPRTRAQLWARNRALRLMPLLARLGLAGRLERRPAYTAIDLPDY